MLFKMEIFNFNRILKLLGINVCFSSEFFDL